VPLKNYSKRAFAMPTASSDPLLQRFAAKSTDEGRCVYATDAVLATIMCAPRSVYSWDVVVEKKGDKLWLDKRDRSNFDLLTVRNSSPSVPVRVSAWATCLPAAWAFEYMVAADS
jgi:translation initiation factor 3 subunit D